MPGALGTGSYAGPYGSFSWGPATQYHVSSIAGVDDLPPVVSADLPRPYLDGSWIGHKRLDERVMPIGYVMIGTDPVNCDGLVQVFQAATIPGDVPGPLLLFNSSRLVNAWVNRRAVAYDAGIRDYAATATVEYVAPDPRVYDANLQVVTAPLPTAVGGFGFPFGFPFGFGGSGTGGIAAAVNAGNYPAPATLSISGPLTNPIVYNDTVGRFLHFIVSLGSTDVLTVDLDQRLVQLNGTANRNGTITSDSSWWLLQPGGNTLRFNADTGAGGAALLSVSFRSTWA